MGFLCIWEWVELPSVHMEAFRREDRLCVAETFYPVRSSNDGLTIQRNEVYVFIHKYFILIQLLAVLGLA